MRNKKIPIPINKITTITTIIIVAGKGSGEIIGDGVCGGGVYEGSGDPYPMGV